MSSALLQSDCSLLHEPLLSRVWVLRSSYTCLVSHSSDGTYSKPLVVQGLARNNAHLFDGSTASWVEMVSTNVLGPAMATREALQASSARLAAQLAWLKARDKMCDDHIFAEIV